MQLTVGMVVVRAGYIRPKRPTEGAMQLVPEVDLSPRTGVPKVDLSPRAGATVVDHTPRAGVMVVDLSPRIYVPVVDLSPRAGATVVDLNPRAGVPVVDLSPRAGATVVDLSPRACVTVVNLSPRAGVTVVDLSPSTCVTVVDLSPRTSVPVVDLSPGAGVTVVDLRPRAGATVVDLSPRTCAPAVDLSPREGVRGVEVSVTETGDPWEDFVKQYNEIDLGASDEEYDEHDFLTDSEWLSNTEYRHTNQLTNAILLVEGERLHVFKEMLMLASPIFYKMFQKIKEQPQPLTLKLDNDNCQHVIWMLEYLHVPKGERLQLADEKAAKLLPLAVKYEMEEMKNNCIAVLMKMVNPRLEIVTLAEQYDLKELLDKAIDSCAKTIASEPPQPRGHSTIRPLGESELDKQIKLPENSSLSKETLNRIYKTKIGLLKKKIQQRGVHCVAEETLF